MLSSLTDEILVSVSSACGLTCGGRFSCTWGFYLTVHSRKSASFSWRRLDW
jgi:hypothetical protein